MASVLLTVGGAVMNALTFSGTNFFFSKFMVLDETEHKNHDLALEKLQRARDEWNKDIMKALGLTNKRLCEKKDQEHTSAIMMQQCLSITEYL